MNGSINLIKTGLNIHSYMQQNNLSVNDIQNACSCSHQAVYQWLSGKILPSVDNLHILAVLFGVSIDDIIVYEQLNDSK